MATPSVSQVASQENWYRSQQVTESLLLAPEVRPDLVERYGKQDFSLNGLSKLLGGVSYISNMEFRHAEEDYLHEVIKVEANGTTYGAGALGTYTIATSYEYDFPADGIASPYITEGVGGNPTASVPMYKNQIIQFPDGTQAIVESVDAATRVFTAYPRASAGVMPETSTTDVIIILGNQVGESATQNPSRSSQVIWYMNNMSIMNGSYVISGSARAEKAWLNTEKGFVWFYHEQMAEEKRLKNEREGRIITDTKTTNTTFADLNTANSTSISFEGLIPFIDSYGNQLPYNLISGITLQDWEDLVVSQLIPAIAASEYAVYAGATPMNYISSFIRAEGKNGGIVYSALGKEQSYIDFDFGSFKVSGHSFHAKHYGLFNYDRMLGAAGQPYKYMFLGIPMDKSDKSVNWDDMTSSKNVPQFVIHYQKSPDGYNREWEEFMLGGANGVYTEGVDRNSVNYRTAFGFEGFGANRYFKGYKS